MGCTIVGVADPRCKEHGNTVGLRCATEIESIYSYIVDLQKKLDAAERKRLADLDHLLNENEKLLAVVGAAYDVLEVNVLRGHRNSVEEVLRKSLEALDTRHHAPMCPANHYHGTRKPTASCSCGAVDRNRFTCPHCERSCDKDSWTCDAKGGHAFCPYCGDPVALETILAHA
jgi:hypothetical protein